MQINLMRFAAIAAVLALASCGQSAPSATNAPNPEAAPAAAADTGATPNAAPLAYIVSQHSPLLDDAVRTAISQDFNGAPLSGARTQHRVTAESVRCRSLNPPSGVPECSVTYGPGQEIAIAGEDAAALFAALESAGVQGDAGMGHIMRALTALQCTVDDAAAQDTPATGDRVAGFSCTFTPA